MMEAEKEISRKDFISAMLDGCPNLIAVGLGYDNFYGRIYDAIGPKTAAYFLEIATDERNKGGE